MRFDEEENKISYLFFVRRPLATLIYRPFVRSREGWNSSGMLAAYLVDSTSALISIGVVTPKKYISTPNDYRYPRRYRSVEPTTCPIWKLHMYAHIHTYIHSKSLESKQCNTDYKEDVCRIWTVLKIQCTVVSDKF